jgi:hypothetical protein
MFGLAVTAIAFKAATRLESADSDAPAEVSLVKTVAAAQSITGRVAAASTGPLQQIPIELLLLQIENHIRQEQAAAELFVEFPTHALLHSKTTSPFVN